MKMLEKLLKNKYVKSVVLSIATIPLLVNIANAETLFEKLQPYLENGKPRQEFFIKRYLWGWDEYLTYNELYRIKDKDLILQYDLAPFLLYNPDGKSFAKPISFYPYVIKYDDREYFDKEQDGINNNEEERLEGKIQL